LAKPLLKNIGQKRRWRLEPNAEAIDAGAKNAVRSSDNNGLRVRRA
jgi:hypothetical protein